MGVKGMALLIETRYPTKIEMQKETTERRRAKPLAAPQALPDFPLTGEEEPGDTSKGTQSQLME